jgi:tRNA-guanine family transglycosylase
MVCARYSRAYLRHLFVAGEPLGLTLNSIHNLHFYLATMDRVRAELAGQDGSTLFEGCHPERSGVEGSVVQDGG